VDITAILTLLMPIITNFIATAQATSPLLNPTIPAAVAAQHPYPTIKLLQHAYNVLAKPAVPLDEDGLWGPQTDTAIAAFLTSHGLVSPSASGA
jgi:peptidoglycan hydrolase-like protein with peptidoglycan-binding domain